MNKFFLNTLLFVGLVSVSCLSGCKNEVSEVRDSRYFETGTITGTSETGTKLNQIKLWNHPTRRTKVMGNVEPGDKIYIIQSTENHFHVGIPDTNTEGWLNKEFVINIKPPLSTRDESGS